MWVFHSFCPYMVPRDSLHISIWALEQNADTERLKKGVGSPRDFQSHEIHFIPCSHGIVLGKKVSARPGPVSCIPLWWWGRRLTVVKVKDMGKRGKWWFWTEGEKERRGGERLEKDHELWRKESLGQGDHGLGGLLKRLERGGRGVHHLTCCQNAANSKALTLLLISRVCKGNVLWEDRENRIGGFSLGAAPWGACVGCVWT